MEVCVSFEEEDFCAWETWRGVAWPLERNVLGESRTSSSSVAAKVRGCSDAGSGENIVWGMENGDEEVEKETWEAPNSIRNLNRQLLIFT